MCDVPNTCLEIKIFQLNNIKILVGSGGVAHTYNPIRKWRQGVSRFTASLGKQLVRPYLNQ
jgi:hypothetical protein